jgi:G:T-mismatch repair DNA endonuclease (very short patch repair protein)
MFINRINIGEIIMILIGEHCKVTKNGKQASKEYIKFSCDLCGKIELIRAPVFHYRIKLIEKEYCGKCSRPLMASRAGKMGAYDKNGNLKPNGGRFSSERVKNMSPEEYKEYCEQRKRAVTVLHKKLKNDPKLRQEHYEKVFKGSSIGYISKGQRELFELLKDDGFLLEEVCEGIRCDIVNPKLKVVFEYYGDVWHANPRTHDPDQYISLIKMTAKEKWDHDRKRNFFLRNLGYKVIIIWESEWKNERTKVFEKIKEYKHNGWKFPKWILPETKRKWMNNGEINKKILNKDVNQYLSDGWIFGRKRSNQ